jgi:hypothetical protein
MSKTKIDYVTDMGEVVHGTLDHNELHQDIFENEDLALEAIERLPRNHVLSTVERLSDELKSNPKVVLHALRKADSGFHSLVLHLVSPTINEDKRFTGLVNADNYILACNNLLEAFEAEEQAAKPAEEQAPPQQEFNGSESYYSDTGSSYSDNESLYSDNESLYGDNDSDAESDRSIVPLLV